MKRVVYALIMIMIFLPGIALAQEESDPENWIKGRVTAWNRDSITIEGKNYRFEPLMTVTDLKENTLNIKILRYAEIVKAFVVDERVRKIVIIVFRE